MTVREVFENGIQPLLMENSDHTPDFIRTRVLQDINAALQVMTTGIDYFTQEPITLSISSGSPTANLPEDTLNVYPPVTLGDGSPLTLIDSPGTFQQYPQIFLGYNGAAPAGKPSGIFFDKGRRLAADNTVKVVARFSPSPGSAYTVALAISRRPTAYAVADLSGTSPTIPLPHKFAESILLPIVRWNVRTSHLFGMKDMLPSMEQEYQAALVQLGLAEATPGTSDSVLERKKGAARAAAREAYANTP